MSSASAVLNKVALIGKPNVGKSSLYNLLTSKSSKAIVNEEAGTTRDLIRGIVDFEDLSFELIDSPGYNFNNQDDLTKLLDANCLRLISEAEILVFVLDGKFGLTALDYNILAILRKQSKPIICCINKSDARTIDDNLLEITKLGLAKAVLTSASSSIGIYDLTLAIANEIRQIDAKSLESKLEINMDKLDSYNLEQDKKNIVKPIVVSLVGKVNVGKSSLLNSILGRKEQISSDIAGFTRDSVAYSYEKFGRKYQLVDTAGRRRRTKLIDKIDKDLYFASRNIYLASDIVCLILSALDTISREDLRIASDVLEVGRCLLIAVNKVDLLSKDQLAKLTNDIENKISSSVKSGKNYKIVHISALEHIGIENLFSSINSLYDRSHVKISTSKLNIWLKDTYFNNPPPRRKNKDNHLKYITQISNFPPRFVVFCSSASSIPDSYVRFLENKFAKDFRLKAIPLTIMLKSNPNPYIEKGRDKK